MAQPNKGDSQLAFADDKPIIAKLQLDAITAVVSGGSGQTAGAFNDAADRDLAITAINSIISVLEANGFIADN